MNAPEHHALCSFATEASRDAVAAADAIGVDAPPSNRASNTCNGERFELLSRHIDSLELSFRGELRNEVAWELGQLKERAQSREAASRSLAQLVVGGHCFEVRDKGAGLFPFVIQDDRFFIRLSRPGNTSLPFASCQVRNSHLLRVGASGARDDLCTLLTHLGHISGPETVSRVEVAVDFVTDLAMDSWGREAWVTRLAYKQAHSVGERFTGWSIGRKDSLQFGLYDKTFEVEHESGKEYLYEVWQKAGWAPWDSVQRAEGRFRRLILHQFGLNTVDDILQILSGLWRYLTETCIRLTVPNRSDETRARWANHPLWNALASVEWGVPSGVLTRTHKGLGAPKDRTIGVRGVSLLTSVMGRDGILEVGPGFHRLRDIIWDYLLSQEIASGLTPEEALIEKAQEKGRHYGTLQNVAGTPTPLPAPDAAALAYREASRGG